MTAQASTAMLPNSSIVENFSDHVLQLIYVRGTGTIASAVEISAQLNITQDTLQRRLKVFGTSYGDLKALYRFELAKYYLLNSSKNMTEISTLLAYKEVDNLFKSFKQWSGKTPGQYRREHLSN